MYAGVVSRVEETAIEFTTDTDANATFGGFMVAFHTNRSTAPFVPHVSLSSFLLCPIRLFLWRPYLLI
jgi:hypothetical protein